MTTFLLFTSNNAEFLIFKKTLAICMSFVIIMFM
jgi:hypothetical protein